MKMMKNQPKREMMSKVVKDEKFTVEILKDVTGINLSKQESDKLSVFLRFEANGNLSLFESIGDIYSIIGANFKNPGRFLIIPFVRAGKEHINIQKVQ